MFQAFRLQFATMLLGENGFYCRKQAVTSRPEYCVRKTGSGA